jgi:hypothetical protein
MKAVDESRVACTGSSSELPGASDSQCHSSDEDEAHDAGALGMSRKRMFDEWTEDCQLVSHVKLLATVPAHAMPTCKDQPNKKQQTRTNRSKQWRKDQLKPPGPTHELEEHTDGLDSQVSK